MAAVVWRWSSGRGFGSVRAGTSEAVPPLPALLEWQAVVTGMRLTTAGREAGEPTGEEWQK